MSILNITEASVKIKAAGAQNVRVVPMDGQNVLDGDYQIQIKNESIWNTIVTGIKKNIAEQIVSQALNRVICG